MIFDSNRAGGLFHRGDSYASSRSSTNFPKDVGESPVKATGKLKKSSQNSWTSNETVPIVFLPHEGKFQPNAEDVRALARTFAWLRSTSPTPGRHHRRYRTCCSEKVPLRPNRFRKQLTSLPVQVPFTSLIATGTLILPFPFGNQKPCK